MILSIESRAALVAIVSSAGSTRASGAFIVSRGTPRRGLRWAQLLADLRGRAMPIKDSLIAATALIYHLPVVTLSRATSEHARLQLVDSTA